MTNPQWRLPSQSTASTSDARGPIPPASSPTSSATSAPPPSGAAARQGAGEERDAQADNATLGSPAATPDGKDPKPTREGAITRNIAGRTRNAAARSATPLGPGAAPEGAASADADGATDGAASSLTSGVGTALEGPSSKLDDLAPTEAGALDGATSNATSSAGTALAEAIVELERAVNDHVTSAEAFDPYRYQQFKLPTDVFEKLEEEPLPKLSETDLYRTKPPGELGRVRGRKRRGLIALVAGILLGAVVLAIVGLFVRYDDGAVADAPAESSVSSGSEQADRDDGALAEARAAIERTNQNGDSAGVSPSPNDTVVHPSTASGVQITRATPKPQATNDTKPKTTSGKASTESKHVSPSTESSKLPESGWFPD